MRVRVLGGRGEGRGRGRGRGRRGGVGVGLKVGVGVRVGVERAPGAKKGGVLVALRTLSTPSTPAPDKGNL